MIKIIFLFILKEGSNILYSLKMFFTFLNFLFFSGTGFLCIKIFSLEYYNNLSGCISLGFFGIFLYNIFSIEEKTEFINRLINYLNNSDAFLLSKQKEGSHV